MRNVALVLGCLAFLGHGRRVQTTSDRFETRPVTEGQQPLLAVEAFPSSQSVAEESSQKGGAEGANKPLNSLLNLLSALKPEAAFNSLVLGARSPSRHPFAVSQAPVVTGRTGPSPVTMADVVVTDGSGAFGGSRALFQTLHDFGDFSNITAFSSVGADTKKILLSRTAYQSGLWDKLDFAEGDDAEFSDALGKASMWIAVNADGSKLSAQVDAASKAGIKRAFIHFSASDASSVNTAELKNLLEKSGTQYTLMRTGSLTKAGMGGGLLVSELDEPTCDEIPIDDVFRFITEAMTMEEAKGRAFSLCASVNSKQLKEMRLAGRTRREEVEALLKGEIKAVDETVEEKKEEVKKDPVVEEKERKDEIEQLKAKAMEKVKLQAEEKARKAEEEKKKQEELEAKKKEKAEKEKAEKEAKEKKGKDEKEKK